MGYSPNLPQYLHPELKKIKYTLKKGEGWTAAGTGATKLHYIYLFILFIGRGALCAGGKGCEAAPWRAQCAGAGQHCVGFCESRRIGRRAWTASTRGALRSWRGLRSRASASSTRRIRVKEHGLARIARPRRRCQ